MDTSPRAPSRGFSPDIAGLPDLRVPFAEAVEGSEFLPYSRHPDTLARPWAIPGTPGLEHRIGGLEHAHDTGNVSYNAENHEQMTIQREQKVAAVAADIPPIEIFGAERADLLVLGWGSTFGSIRSAVMRMQGAGASVSHVHLRHLNPMPLGSRQGTFVIRPGPRPRIEPRPTLQDDPGGISRAHGEPLQGAGSSIQSK